MRKIKFEFFVCLNVSLNKCFDNNFAKLALCNISIPSEETLEVKTAKLAGKGRSEFKQETQRHRQDRRKETERTKEKFA